MATVIIHGQLGTVAWTDDSTADSTITGWVLEGSIDVIDTTSTDDDVNGYRTKTAGHKDWSATVDVLNVGADPSKLANAAASLTLGDATNSIALAKAICTGVNITLDAQDVEKTTFNFVCAGAI